jgi:hypothetical protein
MQLCSNNCFLINCFLFIIQNSVDGEVNHSYILEQNHDLLQGKLERVVDLGEYELGFPWWVLHTDYDDCLVVYQVLKLDQPPDENYSVG